ncbi:aminopeptidase P family protein [Paroceanicella profunda]|uniref:Aminopeptidase P family protein n=1 Tax=Paroceanicella profunda TaxID=2579971 RepID=A0A5B8FUY0_9RHOB|nr:Xaa-Pro peptidase family protein [Paroceanicella profunda]QDL92576.1 aminopeptidase P family protein [Paroceanicella profunda]
MPSRGFSPEDYAVRTARAQSAMALAGLDALLLTSEPDIRYFTGFLTRFWESPTRPWFLVVPAGGAPVAVIPSIGEALMRRTWIRDIRTWASPAPEDDGVSLLADTLGALAGPRGHIGLPMGAETVLRMPLADYARLRSALPDARFRDATAVLHSLQQVKSEAEIARIATACAIAGRAFARVPEIARAGTPLAEVFRRFQMLLLEEGADWVPYLAGGAGPGGYGDVISPADERPLARGDVLMLDTGAVFDGYFCDYDRNFSLGPPAADTVTAQDVLFEATEAGRAAARPGATAADLHDAMQAVIAAAGDLGAGGRLGHGLGMRLTEWPSLTATDRTPLVPGMVLTLEPALEIGPGRMLVHEENIVIREGAAELLSPRAPRALPELE